MAERRGVRVATLNKCIIPAAAAADTVDDTLMVMIAKRFVGCVVAMATRSHTSQLHF